MIMAGTEPPPVPPWVADGYQVVIPHTLAGLRDQTVDAVAGWGGSYSLQHLDDADPTAYAAALIDWWRDGVDLVVVEHDIVPAPGMIAGLLACPEVWCTHPYHVGEGRTTTGLGLCRIRAEVMAARPVAADVAMHDRRGTGRLIGYRSVNEMLAEQLHRYGYRQHIHSPEAAHLHYPRPGAGHG